MARLLSKREARRIYRGRALKGVVPSLTWWRWRHAHHGIRVCRWLVATVCSQVMYRILSSTQPFLQPLPSLDTFHATSSFSLPLPLLSSASSLETILLVFHNCAPMRCAWKGSWTRSRRLAWAQWKHGDNRKGPTRMSLFSGKLVWIAATPMIPAKGWSFLILSYPRMIEESVFLRAEFERVSFTISRDGIKV